MTLAPLANNKVDMVTVMQMQMVGIPWLPLLSVVELLMSPVMKEDSCFLTVSFHIRLMRLCTQKKRGRRGDGRQKVEAVMTGKTMKERNINGKNKMTKRRNFGRENRENEVQNKGKLVQGGRKGKKNKARTSTRQKGEKEVFIMSVILTLHTWTSAMKSVWVWDILLSTLKQFMFPNRINSSQTLSKRVRSSDRVKAKSDNPKPVVHGVLWPHLGVCCAVASWCAGR